MSKRKLIAAASGAAMLAAGVGFFAQRTIAAPQTKAAEAAAAKAINGSGESCCPMVASSDNPTMMHLTLDPSRYMGPARDAYQIARDDPALLQQLHCYCGCDKQYGHRNLLDCFTTDHGAGCEICVGMARDGESMAKRGMSIQQIRDALRARYSHED